MPQERTAMPRPVAGVQCFPFDSGAVLFSEPVQELHLVNSTAAFIWRCLQNGMNQTELVAAVCTELGLNEHEAEQFVHSAIDDWILRRLVGVAPMPSAPTQRIAADGMLNKVHVDAGRFATENVYAVADSVILVRFTCPAQARIVSSNLSHLKSPDLVPTMCIDVISNDSGIQILRNGAVWAHCRRADQLVPKIEGLMGSIAAEATGVFLQIHAGVVGDAKGCVLLPGASGSGKSTLTAALVSRGLFYFSDELALLEDGTFRVVACPLALCVKRSGTGIVAEFFPEIRRAPIHQREDGAAVSYLIPGLRQLPLRMQAQDVRLIIFPSYTGERPASISRLSAGAALSRLLANCLAVSCPLTVPRVQGLIHWFEQIPSHQLFYATASEAAAEVFEVLRA